MTVKQYMIRLFIISVFFFNIAWANTAFQPRVGDLLFQDLNCGPLCNAIGGVTYGVDSTQMSHVGMVITEKHNQVTVIEAVDEGVVETPLSTFLKRSLDQNGNPRVVVGRLIKPYQTLIPEAVNVAKQQLGKPYNPSFIDNGGKSFYCSELIYDVFMKANDNKPVFHEYPMDFRDRDTHQIVLAWQAYFKDLHIPPPTGKLATNPGQLSRESNIRIVHWYGQLRHTT